MEWHRLFRPLGAGIHLNDETQGGARASLALGWFVAGPLALRNGPAFDSTGRFCSLPLAGIFHTKRGAAHGLSSFSRDRGRLRGSGSGRAAGCEKCGLVPVSTRAARCRAIAGSVEAFDLRAATVAPSFKSTVEIPSREGAAVKFHESIWYRCEARLSSATFAASDNATAYA